MFALIVHNQKHVHDGLLTQHYETSVINNDAYIRVRNRLYLITNEHVTKHHIAVKQGCIHNFIHTKHTQAFYLSNCE